MGKTYQIFLIFILSISFVNCAIISSNINGSTLGIEDNSINDTDEVQNVTERCVFKGKVYLEKERIITENPCEQCVCIDQSVLCGLKTCPPSPSSKSCHKVPRPGHCCPSYSCTDENGSTTTEENTLSPRFIRCKVKGKFYEPGSVITSDENVSIICTCLVGGIIQCAPRDDSKEQK